MKFDKEFERYLTNEVELKPLDIESMSANSVFQEVLKYEGYGNHGASEIKAWIKLIYGVDLDEKSHDLFMQE